MPTPTPTRPERAIAGLAVGAGACAWIVYTRAGLILSHYDARAHLVVARRVLDSLTPGWQQVGAVWLPLPHLIAILPTQVDLLYRTGLFASLVSVLAFGVTGWAVAGLVRRMTSSTSGAWTAGLLLVLNPNLLYLHATPMTEPLLLAAITLTVLRLHDWVDDPASRARGLGPLLFATAWTRYEAWPVVVAALVLAAMALRGRGAGTGAIVRRMLSVAAWPAAAVLLFLVNSRLTVGEWFVSGGFFEPDPLYQGQVLRSAIAVWWGTHQMSGYVIELVALGTAGWVLLRPRHRRPTDLVPLALFTAASLPFLAFVSGHPYRVRYMIPSVVACALFGGIAVGLAGQGGRRRAALIIGGLLVTSLLVESPFWRGDAPLVAEAQWDLPRAAGRRQVTACLAPDYRGERVLASMGSLAHYMHELSSSRFDIADFIHEGNGALWQLALRDGPARYAGWMLIEEQSEGGDVLARRIAGDPSFARGMTRVCEGGGVALYRRVD